MTRTSRKDGQRVWRVEKKKESRDEGKDESERRKVSISFLAPKEGAAHPVRLLPVS